MSDEGFWWENSIGYHYATLEWLQLFMMISNQQGIPLHNLLVNRTDQKGTKSIKSMYSAPLLLSLPDFSLPDLNDAGGIFSLMDSF